MTEGRSRIVASRFISPACASPAGGTGEQGNLDPVVGQRPRPGHDAADDHEIGLTADQRPPAGWNDMGVGRARTEDPLVVTGEEADGSGR
jgi:hypothetical protein